LFELKKEVRQGDVVFVLGAGSIEKLCDMIWFMGVMRNITPNFIWIYNDFFGI
jgi:hypothetical protein